MHVSFLRKVWDVVIFFNLSIRNSVLKSWFRIFESCILIKIYEQYLVIVYCYSKFRLEKRIGNKILDWIMDENVDN